MWRHIEPIFQPGHDQIVLGVFANVVDQTFQGVVRRIDGPDDFIDSTGAALLVARQRQLQEAGHRLVLLGPSDPVRRSLGRMDLLFFLELAEIAPARDAA